MIDLKYGEMVRIDDTPFCVMPPAPNTTIPLLQSARACIGACGVNDASEYDMEICPGCLMRAMAFIAMRDALQHIIDNDPEIVACIDWDAREAAHANAHHHQYIDLQSSAHDQYVGSSDQCHDTVVLFSKDIANAMCSPHVHPTR